MVRLPFPSSLVRARVHETQLELRSGSSKTKEAALKFGSDPRSYPILSKEFVSDGRKRDCEIIENSAYTRIKPPLV